MARNSFKGGWLIPVACVIGLGGCAAQNSPQSDPAYVSPTKYDNFNCKQIKAEKALISAKIDQAQQGSSANQFLNAAVTAFAISKGYGYQSDSGNQTLERLKNEQDVLNQAAIKKQCGL